MSDTILNGLNDKQKKVCLSQDNLVVTACPGSGKTRTLIHKIAYHLENRTNIKKIIAITYTNRASNEIIERLNILGVDYTNVWVGTIHQFCLEFILNRFRMYDKILSKEYKIIDERISNNYIKSIAKDLKIKLSYNNMPNLRYDRNFNCLEKNEEFIEIVNEYQKLLNNRHELDFDMILFKSYKLLIDNPFICELIKNSISLICIDEYQDTQDLQYAIIERIYNSNSSRIEIVFFGDPNQNIYETLGGCAKSLDEINKEFYDSSFKQIFLDGCYRSPQNIIDFYSNFMIEKYKIFSNKEKKGIIEYNDKISEGNLYSFIANQISYYIDKGLKPSEICVLAPTWNLLFPFSKKLKEILPGIPFDSPDITPIKKDPLNVFYNIAYLSLTKPSIKNLYYREKTALDIINKLSLYSCKKIKPIDLLNYINSNDCECKKGSEYVKNSIDRVLIFFEIILDECQFLNEDYNNFFEKIEDRLKISKYNLTDDLEDFKNMFNEKNGVVISTIHAVKGEEYEVVIAFGLLESKIPSIYTPQELRDTTANKLIYVMASRCKNILIMISEKRTKNKFELDSPCPYLIKFISN